MRLVAFQNDRFWRVTHGACGRKRGARPRRPIRPPAPVSPPINYSENRSREGIPIVVVLLVVVLLVVVVVVALVIRATCPIQSPESVCVRAFVRSPMVPLSSVCRSRRVASRRHTRARSKRNRRRDLSSRARRAVRVDELNSRSLRPLWIVERHTRSFDRSRLRPIKKFLADVDASPRRRSQPRRKSASRGVAVSIDPLEAFNHTRGSVTRLRTRFHRW